MKPKIILLNLDVKKDDRGVLAEISPVLKNRLKHMFMATILPGKTRGNHYHKHKTEWILLLEGKALVTLMDTKTKKQNQIELTGLTPQLLEVVPHTSVKISNHTKRKAIILVIVDEAFNLHDPDVWQLTLSYSTPSLKDDP